jgi:hypothetical protein
LAVLAVLALVGSLLAVSAVPAVAAADGKASAKARFSACVAAATEDAGFTDMDGNFGEDAANCLAHYGITVGTSEGVFSPNDSITRLQMALFLTRAAGPAGIELDDPEDQGFSDIGGLTDVIQNAINQVVDADIMTGNGNMFNPTGGVSRKDMAVFLDAFLAAAGIELDRKAEVPYNIDEDDIDTPFMDVGGVSFSAYGAINRLYELGVTTGTGDATFTPNALLSRAQMAVFITRALGHTNARPAGLSVQVDPGAAYQDETPTIETALRDSNHDPIPDELVEVFAAQSHVEAFDDEGACSEDLKDEVLGSIGATRCTIDAADEATEPDGNVLLEIDASDFCLADTTLWAWSGDIGDEFDADETDAASAEITVSLTPDDVEVSSDKASNARFLEMGDTASFSLQVVDTDDEPVAIEGLVLVVNVVEMRNSRMQDVTDEYTTDAHGRVEISFTHDDPRAGDDRQGDQASVRVIVTDVLDADGEDYPRIDPTRDTAPSDVTVDWSDRDSLPWDLSISQSVAYHEASDEGSGVRHTVRASLVDQYGDPVSGAKIRFWSNADNADMEGSGDDAEPIPWNNGLGGLDRYEFSEDETMIVATDNEIDVGDVKTDDDGDALAIAAADEHNYADERTTNRRGVATKSYTRDAEEAYIEIISAAFNHNPDDGDEDLVGDTDLNGNEDPVNNPDFDDVGDTVDSDGDVSYTNPLGYFGDFDGAHDMRALDLEAKAVHYWAMVADDGDTVTDANEALTAVAVDTGSNLVVVTNASPASAETDGAADDYTPVRDDFDAAIGNVVLIVVYDSNDQFNTGDDSRVTMSFFESTLDDNHRYRPGAPNLLPRSQLTFELDEDPEDGVNRLTNTNGASPTQVSCVVAEA